MSDKKNNNTTKKTLQVLYTSDELRAIGSLLQSGDAYKIVEIVGAGYHNVIRILSGNDGNGITSKSKKGKMIVQEALKIINGYVIDLEVRINDLQDRKKTYLSIVNTMQRASA